MGGRDPQRQHHAIHGGALDMNEPAQTLGLILVVGLPVLALLWATAGFFATRNMALFLPADEEKRVEFIRRFTWLYRASAVAVWCVMFAQALRAYLAGR